MPPDLEINVKRLYNRSCAIIGFDSCWVTQISRPGIADVPYHPESYVSLVRLLQPSFIIARDGLRSKKHEGFHGHGVVQSHYSQQSSPGNSSRNHESSILGWLAKNALARRVELNHDKKTRTAIQRLEENYLPLSPKALLLEEQGCTGTARIYLESSSVPDGSVHKRKPGRAIELLSQQKKKVSWAIRYFG